MRNRKSFTLIEMLVVVAVIAALAGMVFKLVQIIARNAKRAKCVRQLELIAHAMEEFKAEYGSYPPVQPRACMQHTDCMFCYVCESVLGQTPWLKDRYFSDNPNEGNRFSYGLMSFLVLRDQRYRLDDVISGPHIIHTNASALIADTDRDLAAKERWQHFIAELYSVSKDSVNELPYYFADQEAAGTPYTNAMFTVLDPWYNVLRFDIRPPYQTYELWSVGPDGKNGTADDIHYKKWDN